MKAEKKLRPWYAGEHQDVIFYLMTAIFFVELIVGGIAFFYGIMHAAPDMPGGPPVARFPWLAWALAAFLSPVALLLIVHVAGNWVFGAITREENIPENDAGQESNDLPPKMRRFYQAVQHAPTIVILLALLLVGAGLFFIDGALAALGNFGSALVPYIPWIAGSVAALLSVCFLTHAIMVYRQRKMENEYAWRREVLEKTGLVLTDKNTLPLPLSPAQAALLPAEEKVPKILDVTTAALTAYPENPGDSAEKNG